MAGSGSLIWLILRFYSLFFLNRLIWARVFIFVNAPSSLIYKMKTGFTIILAFGWFFTVAQSTKAKILLLGSDHLSQIYKKDKPILMC